MVKPSHLKCAADAFTPIFRTLSREWPTGREKGCFSRLNSATLGRDTMQQGSSLTTSSVVPNFQQSIRSHCQLTRLFTTSPAVSLSSSVDKSPTEDTIFALSSGFTPQRATALAVIRLSGPRAHYILQSLVPHHALPPARQATLRKLYHPTTDTMLDQALVIRFDRPHSFTGEDLVELHCHGSRAVVQGVLDALQQIPALKHTCRPAEAGEFTQRAYSNGKLDLVQVEALADVLAADTQAQLTQALSQLDGRLSCLYQEWRTQLIAGMAHAEAVIDFGDDEQLGDDDDDDESQWEVWGGVRERMQQLAGSMREHLRDDRRGELLREGVKIAIVGAPNAGKSSLFNLLARQEAAIVSPIAGTTRDVLQVSLDLDGVKCILHDTAGVRSATDDMLELEGIRRAQSVAENADVLVVMVDATEENSSLSLGIDTIQQLRLSSTSPSPPILLVLNKLDMHNSKSQDHFVKAPPQQVGSQVMEDLEVGTFQISCTTQEGVEEFLEGLKEQVVSRVRRQGNGEREGAMITRARHRGHVLAAMEALERFDLLSVQGTMAVDMAAEELRLAVSELGRITGAVDVEDVLDVLFTDFCIGK